MAAAEKRRRAPASRDLCPWRYLPYLLSREPLDPGRLLPVGHS